MEADRAEPRGLEPGSEADSIKWFCVAHWTWSRWAPRRSYTTSNFKHIRRQAKVELGKTGNNWPKKEKWNVATHFHLVPPSAREAKTKTLSQRYFLRSQPYYYIVLLSPFVCVGLIFSWPRGMFFCFASIAGFSLGQLPFSRRMLASDTLNQCLCSQY